MAKDQYSTNVSSQLTDVASFSSTRPDLLCLISQPPRNALDIGCGSGQFGHAIKEKFQAFPCKITGVEIDLSRAMHARLQLDRVIQASIEDEVAFAQLEGEKFDLIVCADVLEHLVSPRNTLVRLRELLTEQGLLLVSLPNVSHWSVLYSLIIRREWPEENSGIFDRTHLRWFTLKSSQRILTESGYRVEQVQLKYPFFGQKRLRGLVGWFISKVPFLREYFAYQIFLIGRHAFLPPRRENCDGS